LLNPLLRARGRGKRRLVSAANKEVSPVKVDLFREALMTIPTYLIENAKSRRVVAMEELIKAEGVWTIDSLLMRSSGDLIRETESEITAIQLSQLCKLTMSAPPQGIILCNKEVNDYFNEKMDERVELTKMHVLETERRVDALWTLRKDKQVWMTWRKIFSRLNNENVGLAKRFSDIFSSVNRDLSYGLGTEGVNILIGECEIVGGESFWGVRLSRETYLGGTQEIGRVLTKLLSAGPEGLFASAWYLILTSEMLNLERVGRQGALPEDKMRIITTVAPSELFMRSRDEYIAAVRGSSMRVFDPYAWSNRRAADTEGMWAAGY
jgi:hypothetical protein